MSTGDGRVGEMRYTLIMEPDSALKNKDILTDATTWMNFRDIVLSERSQSQRDKRCRIPFTQVLRGVEVLDTGRRTGLPGAGKKRTGTESQLCRLRSFLQTLAAMVARHERT